jgi:hypothetical protein
MREPAIDQVFDQNGKAALNKIAVPKSLNVEVTIKNGQMVFKAITKKKE